MVRASPMAQQVKECRKYRRHGFDPWKRKWQPIPGFLSENPKQEEPGGLVHRVTKGWTQTKHTIWFDNRDISRNKEVTKSSAMPGILSRFLQLLHLYLFSIPGCQMPFCHYDSVLTFTCHRFLVSRGFSWPLRGAVRCSAESPPLVWHHRGEVSSSGVGYHVTHGWTVNRDHLVKGLP